MLIMTSQPPPGLNPEPDTDADVGAAARALADAASALTKALGESFKEVKPQLSGVFATGLREAAEGLAQASAGMHGSARRFAADRRSERAAQTRSDILDAAARVIAEKGYAGASMEDIAAAAGYTKGAIYSHFASKEDLFAELAIQLVRADQPLPGPNQLPSLLAQGLRANPTDPAAALLTLEILELTLRSQSFRDRVVPAFAAGIEHLAAQVAANRHAAGPAQRDRTTAIGLFAIINTATLAASVLGPANDPAKIALDLATQLLGK
jgi:AcrR family transcriptional regulator